MTMLKILSDEFTLPTTLFKNISEIYLDYYINQSEGHIQPQDYSQALSIDQAIDIAVSCQLNRRLT